MKTQTGLSSLYSVLVVFASSVMVYGQGTVPADFKIKADSGGLSPFTDNTGLSIESDGQCVFWRYLPGAAGQPLKEETHFTLSSAQLDQIWTAIQDNDFFSLSQNYSNPAIHDGSFAHLIVQANGCTNEVITKNIPVLNFDNIIAVINAQTPATNDLEYSVFEPPVLVPRDLCGGFLAATADPRQQRASEKKLLQREKTATARPPAQAHAKSLALSPGAEELAGTTVACRLSLQEAVDLGIVTLEGKGGYFGDAVSISADNTGNIRCPPTVKLYLEFYGSNATDENAAKISEVIQSTWSGKTTTDGKPITVSVHTRVAPGASEPPNTPGYHQIKLESIDDSIVHGLGTTFDINRGVGSGTWNPPEKEQAIRYAHEAGHLMGLPDRYEGYGKQDDGSWVRESDGSVFTSDQLATEITPKFPDFTLEMMKAWLDYEQTQRITVPNDPNANDVMGTNKGSPQPLQSDLDVIAAQAGLEVDVQPGDVLVNKDESSQNLVATHELDMFVAAGQSKTLEGVYVACIDNHRSSPSYGGGFDVGPSLENWSGIEAASALLQLVKYMDKHELFCGYDFAAQLGIWRLTDNTDSGDSDVSDLLQSAGINVGDRVFNFPRLSDPNAGSTNTTTVTPTELGSPLTIIKLQANLNFAKASADNCSVNGALNLPSNFSFAGKLVTLNIGGADVSFALDNKGKGQTGLSKFSKPTYNKKTGLWTFSATLKNGSWQSSWAEYGMVNSTILKPGLLVTNFPVIVAVGTEAFMGTASLHYTAKQGKSGTAK
jgi:hypothetical protein